jgi:hypothetical protein
MDILSQLINGMTRNLLPQGHDYSNHAPEQALQDGRVDIIISHAIAGQISTAHPVVQAVYGGARALLDGALTAVAGPVAIEGMLQKGASALGYGSGQTKTTAGTKRVSKTGKKKTKTTAVARRVPEREYTAAGVEILDAEFVDMPGASAPGGQR